MRDLQGAFIENVTTQEVATQVTDFKNVDRLRSYR